MEEFESLRHAHNATKNGYCTRRPQAEPMTIECDTLTNCKSCGWNPEVERYRLKQIRNKLNIPDPDNDRLIRVK